MSSSCLNRTLISDAVAGTGTNVSLLIQALSPLCPPPTPLVKVAADHRTTVVVGYICGFLPWTMIVLFDFISAKWKTVRKTRQLGYFHLVACVIPMVFVIGYAVLQALSGDYKEMMTAVIAVVLTLYHVARTLWGLVQLSEYLNWCRHTLQCIRATQPKHRLYKWKSAYKSEDDDMNHLECDVLVNEDIVDNEFAGRDVSMSYSFTNRNINIYNPQVCAFRWATAFLCSLGHEWKSEGSKLLHEKVQLYLGRTLLYTDRSQASPCPVSFKHLFSCFNREDWNSLSYGSYSSESFVCGDDPLESLRFEFDNIVSSFPTSDNPDGLKNRKDARLELVEFILAARMVGPERMQQISSHYHERCGAFSCRRQFDDAFLLLQGQLGIERLVLSENVHWFWKLAMVPLSTVDSYAFSFQTSAYVDNCISVAVGNHRQDHTNFETLENEPVDLFERYNNLLTSLDCSDSRYILGVSLDLVRTLLAKSIMSISDSVDPALWHPDIPKDVISFSLSENILSTLPTIYKKTSDPDYYSQAPDILGYVVDFVDRMYEEGIMYLLQECQTAIRQLIYESTDDTASLPKSTEMISLFLLSYPGVTIKVLDLENSSEIIEISHSSSSSLLEADTESEVDGISDLRASMFLEPFQMKPSARYEIKIELKWAPQDLWLSLVVDGKTGDASLKIGTREDEMKFEWEKWINCAMALLKSYNYTVRKGSKNTGGFCGPLESIREVHLSRPMMTLNRDEEDEILSHLPGQLHVWTGWPIFDQRFCQFELAQWMEACGALPKNNNAADEEYEQRKEKAMKTLLEIATWNRM